LALCKKFVELHGGRMRLVSEVGRGLDVLVHDSDARESLSPRRMPRALCG
jgi:hypothetical protein